MPSSTQQTLAVAGFASLGILAYVISRKCAWKKDLPSEPKLQVEYAARRGIRLRVIAVDGHDIEVAEAGKQTDPMVLLVHGWPEGWGSWTHQLTYLAKLGFHAVAPSMRGYGFTYAPEDPKEYGIEKILADALGVIKAVGHTSCHLVGHDWGAICCWHFALLRPDVFKTVFCMSVPLLWKVGKVGSPASFVPRLAPSEVRPTEAMREKFGSNFYYILYHNEIDGKGGHQFSGPAEREYMSAAGEFYDRMFRNRAKESRDAQGLPKLKLLLWRKLIQPANARTSGGFIRRMPPAGELPDWSREERAFWLNQYAKSGFIGGTNYYRNFDANFDAMFKLQGASITQPSGFLYGTDDVVPHMVQPTWLEDMRVLCPKMTDAAITKVPEGSHWIMLEKPDAVNAALGPFLLSNPVVKP